MSTKAKTPRRGQGKPVVRTTSERRVIAKRRPISELGWAKTFAEKGSMGTDIPSIVAHLGNQLCSCVFLPEDAPAEEVDEQLKAAILTVMRLAPSNELEAMLAVQTIAAHNAAMECMRRAMYPTQTDHGRDLFFKHAEKLFRIFKEQAEVIGRIQRARPQLAASNAEYQSEAEGAKPTTESGKDSIGGGQADNLHEIRSFLEEKKAS